MVRKLLGLVALVTMPSLANAGITNLYVFGDSLSDTGNLYNKSMLMVTADGVVTYNDKANFPGPTVPPGALLPTNTNNIGTNVRNGIYNANIRARYNYTVGRLTDGTDTRPAVKRGAPLGLWDEQLAAQIPVPAIKPSSSGGNNYAFASATTAAGQTNLNVSMSNGGIQVSVTARVDNIGGQVDNFIASLNGGKADPKGLYAIWGGGNDLLNATEKAINGGQLNQIGKAEQDAVTNIQNYIES
jgi:phospholipase/lecithinase/hemolysin